MCLSLVAPDVSGEYEKTNSPHDVHAAEEINEMLLHMAESRWLDGETGAIDGFSFTWGSNDADSVDMQVHPAADGDSQDDVTSSDFLDSVTGLPTQDTYNNSRSEDHEVDIIIPAEFGGCHPNMPSPKKFGTLRKYSSLNFDLDTLPSAPSSGCASIGGATPSSGQQLRKSQSVYASPFTQTSSGTRNKLRKRVRPEDTPVSAYVQYPILDLPPGIEQIGNGIGYMRRATPVHARLSMSTLTPRACHGFFAGGRFSGMTPRKKTGSGERLESAGGGVAVMDCANDSEDQMDAVMHEMYGSRWNLGLSASELSHAGGAHPRVYSALSRTSVGLGLGEGALDMTRGGGMPMPSSTYLHGTEYC